MPQYSYECDACEHTFEEWHSYESDNTELCPECSGETHIVIGLTPVHYKAAGFKITETRGLTGHERRPNIKVGMAHELPPEERERAYDW